MPHHCARIASKVAVGSWGVARKAHLAQHRILLVISVLEQQVTIFREQWGTLVDDGLQVGIAIVLRNEGRLWLKNEVCQM